MILLIDTSQETGTVALSWEGRILCFEENKVAKEHAIWLHMAIGRMVKKMDTDLKELNAVAVVAGPGSYTGLRVGMAAAKGFCYALKIPLITLNTLLVMAEAMRDLPSAQNTLLSPMIDARRNEVFTAVYGPKAESLTPKTFPSTVNRQPLTEILPPQAMILDKNSFEKELSTNTLVFFGSGAAKWKQISASPSAIFEPQQNITQAFASLAGLDFEAGKWADTVYSEPVYLKEFFSY